MQQFSDSHILSIAKTNKTKALELAFDQYWELLFRHAYRKLNEEALAKDLVQEVFIVLWENFDKLIRQEELLPYLYAVLRNHILSQYKKDSVRLKFAVDHAGKGEETEPSSHQLLLSKELKEIIQEEVNKMPARMKEIYILKKEENCSIKEIAGRLNITEQTVKNQLFMASGKLKGRLLHYDPSLLPIGLIISGVVAFI